MKREEIKELHQKTIAQLLQQLEKLQKQLAKAKLELAADKLENTSLVKHLGYDIARIKTIITEKRMAQANKKENKKE